MEYQGKADVITAALRELIITGEVAAGTALRQRDLAIRFGVSPTPVREALRRLEAEGLVDHDLHRGWTVIEASLNPDDEGLQVRAALESLAARLAAERITGEELDHLQKLHEEFAASRDGAALPELNRRFHFAIYEAAQSPTLLSLLRMLWQAFRQGPKAVRPQEQSASEHAQMVDALRRGDADAADRIMRAHILRALKEATKTPKPSSRAKTTKPSSEAKTPKPSSEAKTTKPSSEAKTTKPSSEAKTPEPSSGAKTPTPSSGGKRRTTSAARKTAS